MMGREAVLETFTRAARGADIAVIEGMMGLYDGATPNGDEGSTAEIAKWLAAPVILTVDASGMARSIAAVATGFARFDPALRLAGLICNRVGSRGHLDLLRAALADTPVFGGLPQNSAAAFPERHLGLFSAGEDIVPAASFAAWEALAAQWFDLDAIVALARSAPDLNGPDLNEAELGAAAAADRRGAPRCRIGVAYDEAFNFYYEYNLARLEALGAELVRFSPVRDRALPAALDGLYFGGGYPEVAARDLAANHPMLEAVRAFAARKDPIYAECGGLMYLAEAIRTLDGVRFPMAGLIAGEAVMHDRLQALGYVEVQTRAPSLLGPTGTRWRGHQFRYSTLQPPPPDESARLYTVSPRWGGAPYAEGYCAGSVVASYVHGHWASNPAVAAAIVAACVQARERRR
jgi:cobyrinic acid a,c-diamide synthase